MLADLEKCRVTEIAPDILMLEGYAGTMFFLEPPSGNIFVMRDRDLVLVMDTGHHGFFRKSILEALSKFKKEGARELVLVLSHGHWDHGKNNDVIFEAGYEKVRFLLPEPEFATINIPEHMSGDLDRTREYYDPLEKAGAGLTTFLDWAVNFPEYSEPRYQKAWQALRSVPAAYDPVAARAAYRALLFDVLCPDLSSYAIDRAEPLALAGREKLVLGEVELTGWPVGRFFLWHDASQSPGHLCIYDPKSRLMITGDATLEINPPFFDCDFNACLETCRVCLRLAESGYIDLATDCHRTSQWWPRSFAAWGVTPLDPIQLVDVARGRKECSDFYRMWVDYFGTLRDEVLLAHARIGEAAVSEIYEELKKSNNKNVVFKLGLTMPNIPSNPETLVAKVLAESGASRRVDGERILFTPVEKWNFSKR
jgi:glyoxylase-like metal-dependent hydrolase (beta-lactamase superfamily II)